MPELAGNLEVTMNIVNTQEQQPTPVPNGLLKRVDEQCDPPDYFSSSSMN